MGILTLIKGLVLFVGLILYLYSLTIIGNLQDYNIATINITFFLILVSGIIIGQKAEELGKK